MRKPFDFSGILNSAIQQVLASVILGIHKGSQFGQKFATNAESTVKQKGFNKPLVGKKGLLKPFCFTVLSAFARFG